MKTNTPIWLLAAAIVIATMVGYTYWTGEKSEPPTTRHGVVTGIMYAEEKPSAVVGDKIVYEGDIVDGVKVVKIYRDKVEFEKKGKRWTQGVQEKPNRAWPKAD